MSNIKKKSIDEKKFELIDRLASKSIKGGTRLWCVESHACVATVTCREDIRCHDGIRDVSVINTVDVLAPISAEKIQM